MTPKSYQLKFDDYTLLLNEKLLLNSEGTIVAISTRAFDLLTLFAQNEGKVILKQELLDKVWSDTFVEEGNLAVAVNSLRRALKTDDGKVYIETFPKRGYRFNAKVERVLVESNRETEKKQPASLSDTPFPNRTETAPASLSQSTLKTYPQFHSQILQRKWLLLTILIMVLSFSFSLIFVPEKIKVDAQENAIVENRKSKIAVLPFVNLRPGVENKDLGIRFADSMMYELSQSKEFSIVSTLLADKYFQKIPHPEELKKEVGVDFVLAGTFIKTGEIIEIDSQLIEVKSGKTIMTNKDLLNSNDSLELNEEFTKKLVAKIKLCSNALSLSVRLNRKNKKE